MLSLARCRPSLARAFGLVLIVCSWPTWADDDRALREQQAVMASKAFLDAHPDLKHRTEGFLRLEEGRTEDARRSFLEAARFADKPSQAVLAEMAWKGVGQPADRPRAYAWADISAERGYPQLVAIRESYWEQLSDEERERAIEIGQSLMDEYGDEVAKARMALHLRKARRTMISFRPRKDVTVIVPDHSGFGRAIRGHNFYATEFWDPEEYQAWVDDGWMGSPEGKVDVGEVEQFPDEE